MNTFSEDFDSPNAPATDPPEAQFKECVMLVCRWWYPDKEQPHSLVDAIYITRAEPTELGVRVSVKLKFIAKSGPVDTDRGKIFTSHEHFDLAGKDADDALKSIESGDDAFFIHLSQNKESAKRVALRLQQLHSTFEHVVVGQAIGNSELEQPPARSL